MRRDDNYILTSNGNWSHKRGALCQKEPVIVNCFGKNGSTNLLEVELRRLEIRTSCNRFLTYRGSPDSKDLWVDKYILNYTHAFSCKKCNSIALGIILAVLYPGIFTMILTAAFRII